MEPRQNAHNTPVRHVGRAHQRVCGREVDDTPRGDPRTRLDQGIAEQETQDPAVGSVDQASARVEWTNRNPATAS